MCCSAKGAASIAIGGWAGAHPPLHVKTIGVAEEAIEAMAKRLAGWRSASGSPTTRSGSSSIARARIIDIEMTRLLCLEGGGHDGQGGNKGGVQLEIAMIKAGAADGAADHRRRPGADGGAGVSGDFHLAHD